MLFRSIRKEIMNQNKKETISEYLKAIADKEEISEDDVRNEIALAHLLIFPAMIEYIFSS